MPWRHKIPLNCTIFWPNSTTTIPTCGATITSWPRIARNEWTQGSNVSETGRRHVHTMMTHSTGTTTPATLQFATALSRKTDTEAATRDLADAILGQVGTAPIDLAFVFFSAHHAAKASMISGMLQKELRAQVRLG